MQRRGLVILAIVALMAGSGLALATIRGTYPTRSFAAQSADISGEWSGSFELEGVIVQGTLSLKLDGERVTGNLDTEHTGKGALRNGRWVEGLLSFNVDFEAHDSIAFVGRLVGGKLVGEFDTEHMTGKWQATRK